MEGLGLSSGFSSVQQCRACGSDSLFPVLDIGEQPLANRFVRADSVEPEPMFPLAVLACAGCSLVQLSGTVDPRLLFEDYRYLSSISRSFVDAARDLALRVIRERGLGERDLVVDIGSNDGYLLRHYRDAGLHVLGVEPASGIAAVARDKGVDTLTAYFNEDVAASVRASHGAASVVHANNVMAHVPDVNSFVAGLSMLLADDGVVLVESPYVLDLVDNVEFDTIYHEHVFYYSLTAVQYVAARHGLVVTQAERLPVHGGSVRYHLRREGSPTSDSVAAMLAAEQARGVDKPSCYAGLTERVQRIRVELPQVLRERRSRGERIAAYGAAAKGTVLLNACSITSELVDFVADRNPRKQGLLMPGVGIPIEPAEALVERQPSATLLLAWNLADEIVADQRAYCDAGGTFIVPIPEVRVIAP